MGEDIYESFDQMIELCHKKIGIMIKLKKSLRMAALIGRKPSDIKAPMRHRTITESHYFPWRKAVYALQVEGEPEQQFKLTDVHLDLWPDEIRDAYLRHKKQKESTNERH